MNTMSALPSARLASLNARSFAASTPNVSHSMSVPCFARQAAVTSPPGPVVAAALCTAWPMIVRRSAANARVTASGPASAAATAPAKVFNTCLRDCTGFLLRELLAPLARDTFGKCNLLALEHEIASGCNVAFHRMHRTFGVSRADRFEHRDMLLVDAPRAIRHVVFAER